MTIIVSLLSGGKGASPLLPSAPPPPCSVISDTMEERGGVGGGVEGGISKHGARIEGMVKRIKGGGRRKKEGWWQGGKRHFPTAACFGGSKKEEEEVEVVERGGLLF